MRVRRKPLTVLLGLSLLLVILVYVVIPKIYHPYNIHLFQLYYLPGWRETTFQRAALDRPAFEQSFLENKNDSANLSLDDWSQSDYKFHRNETVLKPIPKIIWTYWRGNPMNMADIIRRCMETWKDFNPDYEIRLVSTENIHDYIPSSEDPNAPPECQLPHDFDKLESNIQSDWLRLTLLRLYGGIWIDASTILTDSLDFIHSYQGKTDGFMYSLNALSSQSPKYPIVESWFISSAPHGDFITKWQKEFDFLIRHFGSNGFAYVAHLEETFGQDKVKSLIQHLSYEFQDYLKIHIAAQKVMQLNGAKSIATQEACDGPLKLISQVGWHRRRMASKLNDPITEPLSAVIKLRAQERESAEFYLKFFRVRKDSIYSRYLKY